jgi:hypothetical protein
MKSDEAGSSGDQYRIVGHCFSSWTPGGVDLTFATHLAAGSSSECQIQNSTAIQILLVVL